MLYIEASSTTPIYLQLIQQVEQLVTTERWNQGDPVPSVRQVARELGINPMTVSKAYSQLESMGLLQGQKGKGMVVGASRKDPRELLLPQMTDLRSKAKDLGVTPKELARWLVAIELPPSSSRQSNDKE